MGSEKKTVKRGTKRITKPGQALSQSEWENRLAKLYHAMRTQPSRDQAMSHAEVEEVMPLYVEIEQSGSDPALTYPLVHQHLQTCSQCRAMYNRIKSALEFPSPRARAVPQSFRFAKNIPQAKTAILQIIQTPVTGRAFENIQFLILPPPLPTRTPPTFAVRGEIPIEQALLFSAQVTLDKHPILVQAWIAPAAKKNHANLRVELAASASVARRAQAILDWGDNHFESKFSRGVTTFKDVIVTAPDSPISLTLEFPAHARSRPHSKPRSTTRPTKRDAQTRAKKV